MLINPMYTILGEINKVTRNIDKINISVNSKQQYNALLKSNQYYKN